MTRQSYTRKVRILKEYTAKDLKKRNGRYPQAVFAQFRNKPVFYVIKPPHCVEGVKLGRAANGETRLKSYQHKYGLNFEILYVITLARRTSTETGESAQDYFEKMVKQELRGQTLPGRGAEFYRTARVITAAVDRVKKKFEGKFEEQVGTRRVSLRNKNKEVPTPKVNDKVLFIWEHTGKTKRQGVRPYRAKIKRHVRGSTYELLFSDGQVYKISLPKSKYSTSPSTKTPGQWKIL